MRNRALSLMGMGGSLAIWVVGGTLLGRWLDGKFETDPLLTVLLLFLGLAIGLYDAYRRLRELVAFNNQNGN